MISELAKHIETLLLENDCVIIPEFGGFIAQYMPACKTNDGSSFLPPYRTVGFNPNLTLNDGLLIQSYMKAYDVNYPEASRLVEGATEELRKELWEKGDVVIPGVGKLILDIENKIEFCPNEKGTLSPALYGLTSFEMSKLAEEEPVEVEFPIERTVGNQKKNNTLVIRINRTLLNNAVAVAAAVILFFFLSTPVDNTYVEPENYAFIGDASSLFDKIRSQSVATSLIKATTPNATSKPVKHVAAVPSKKQPKAEAAVKKATAPVEVKKVEAKPASTPVVKEASINKAVVKETIKEEPKAPVKQPEKAVTKQTTYHIIVASVTNMSDAEKSISYFADKGYAGGKAIEGNGRVRIAISSFTDKNEADAKLAELRKLELFQNAWMLTSRN